MRLLPALLLGLMPILAFGQSHSIDQHELFMSGTVEDLDININTYYNAIDAVQVEWSIVETDVPEDWEYSFCFPNCHPIGVVEANAQFPAASEQYLNCHVYPNGIAGEGILRMQLTTNGAAQDTVTWHATIDAVSGLENRQALGIQAFPVPCVGQLQLEGIPAGATVVLQDEAGATVRELRATSAQRTLIDNLTPGVYVLMTTLNGQLVDRRRILSL